MYPLQLEVIVLKKEEISIDSSDMHGICGIAVACVGKGDAAGNQRRHSLQFFSNSETMERNYKVVSSP